MTSSRLASSLEKAHVENAGGTRIDNHAAFIWSVADLLRGEDKQSEYGKVILPLTVLRRLDCVLEPTKKEVLARAAKLRGQVDNMKPVLCSLAGQSFYNTGISTYFGVLTNRKHPERRGKVQLIDAREYWVKMRKSLGDKRKEISADQIAEIILLYADFTECEQVKILPNESFGFQRITVERPLRLRWEVTAQTAERLAATKQWARLIPDEQRGLSSRLSELVGVSTTDRSVMATKLGAFPKAIEKQTWDVLATSDPEAPVVTNRKGEPEADPDLRDNENVPLPPIPVTRATDPTGRLASIEYRSAVDDYIAEEVLPYVPDAWVDHTKSKIGYEIPLTRHFYKYVPPRPLAEIDAEIQELLREVTE